MPVLMFRESSKSFNLPSFASAWDYSRSFSTGSFVEPILLKFFPPLRL